MKDGGVNSLSGSLSSSLSTIIGLSNRWLMAQSVSSSPQAWGRIMHSKYWSKLLKREEICVSNWLAQCFKYWHTWALNSWQSRGTDALKSTARNWQSPKGSTSILSRPSSAKRGPATQPSCVLSVFERFHCLAETRHKLGSSAPPRSVWLPLRHGLRLSPSTVPASLLCASHAHAVCRNFQLT